MAFDVLDDHDGVIRNQTQSGGYSGESHEVDSLPHDTERETHDCDRERDCRNRDQCKCDIPQEEEQDHPGKHDSDDDRVASSPHGSRDE
jgi:hypothetical protein